MIEGELGAGRCDVAPDLLNRLQQECARGPDPDFRLRGIGLHHRVVADWALHSARYFVAREIDEYVQRRAGESERDTRKSDLVEMQAAHSIKRAGLAAL